MGDQEMRSFCNNRVGIDVQPFIQLRSYGTDFPLRIA